MLFLANIRSYVSRWFFTKTLEERHRRLRFRRDDILGEGSTSVVFRGVYEKDDSAPVKVAIKRPKYADHDVTREVEMMRIFNDYDSFIHLHSVIKDRHTALLATDLCEGGDLYAYVEKHEGGLPDEEVRTILRWLVDAVAVCQKHRIYHGDLKLENIVLTKRDDLNGLKLIDFESARYAFDAHDHAFKYTSRQVLHSLHYLAPEVPRNGTLDYGARYFEGADLFALDVWSVGIIAFILCHRKYPYTEFPSATCRPRLECADSELRNFIRRALCADPKKRATISELAAHPFLHHTQKNGDYQCNCDIS